MNYRYKLQETLNDNDENHTLKTNEEVKNIIREFGCGWTEFHTADIERLIKEHEKMYKLLKESDQYLHIGFNTKQESTILEIRKAIELYCP
jgi:hypothetical protein